MLLANLFRRTSRTGPTGRHRHHAGPQHRAVTRAEVAAALPTVHECDRAAALAAVVARHLDPDAPTRLLRFSEMRDVPDEGRPADPLRQFMPPLEPDAGATA